MSLGYTTVLGMKSGVWIGYLQIVMKIMVEVSQFQVPEVANGRFCVMESRKITPKPKWNTEFLNVLLKWWLRLPVILTKWYSTSQYFFQWWLLVLNAKCKVCIGENISFLIFIPYFIVVFLKLWRKLITIADSQSSGMPLGIH